MRGKITQAQAAAGDRSAFEVPTSWWAALGLAAVVGVTALFGGLAPAQYDVATVAASEPLTNDVLQVQVHGVEITDDIEEYSLQADEGESIVRMDARFTNAWTAPLGLDTRADRMDARPVVGGEKAILTVGGIAADIAPEFERADGTRGLIVLQPDLPVEVVVVWIVPSDDVPSTLDLTLHGMELTSFQQLLSDDVTWWKPTQPVMATTVPVRTAAS